MTQKGFIERFAPSKRSLCCCLREYDEDRAAARSPSAPQPAPPAAVLSLKALGIAEELPFPQTEDELNSKFAIFLVELGLNREQCEELTALPAEKKWQIYCSRQQNQDQSKSFLRPGTYVDTLKELTYPEMVGRIEPGMSVEGQIQFIDGLKTALRTQPITFVQRFLELSGLTCLLNYLKTLDKAALESRLHTLLIGCISNIMNSADGRRHVLALPTTICRLAESLAVNNIKTKTIVLEVLGAICMVPGGHRKVLQAMSHFQRYFKERTRFQTIVLDLDRALDEDFKTDVNFKTAIMLFINAAIKYGAGQDHLEFRLHLRYEFLMLGIAGVIDKLRLVDNLNLNRHLDFFEMLRNEDEKELAKRFETQHVDSKSARSMFDVLAKKLMHSPAYSYLQSMLFHLLQLPYASTKIIPYWQLMDRMIQQVVLQQRSGDPDEAVLNIDIQKLLSQLVREESTKDAYRKVREVQKENDDLATKLLKKARECKKRSIEKEELLATLNRLQTKHEKESNDLKTKVEELSTHVSSLLKGGGGFPGGSASAGFPGGPASEGYPGGSATGGFPGGPASGGFPGGPASEGYPGGSASGGFPGGNGTDPSASVDPTLPVEKESGGSPPSTPLADSDSCIPPAPPPPPPPPPIPDGFFSSSGTTARRKNVPESTQPLKSLNWVKLPDNQINKTIWNDVDDAKIFSRLDLPELERNFSAYQRKDGVESEKGPSRSRELTIIDGRRAQNCTILLSKLKMSCRELSEAVLSVDAQEDLPKDMCEQLLKFVPTTEEVQMFNDQSIDLEQMAIADYFLYQMSRIDRYEERLKTLYYKKKFSERMNEAIPKVKVVLDACRGIQSSAALKKFMELTLALGNFMNKGQRGNASGFRIISLTRISDTRSSVDKRSNLMNYIALLIDNSFSECQNIDEELGSVREASKVNRVELESEITLLRIGLKDTQLIFDYYKNKNPEDPIIEGLSEFIQVAPLRFSDLDEDYVEMKKEFEKVVTMFAEDPKTAQCEEFFGVFSTFLTSYNEARLENERFKRLREDEDKRAQREAEREERNRQMRERVNNTESEDNPSNEFDDLISALRSGDVFRDDLVRDRRTRNRKSSMLSSTSSNVNTDRKTSTSRTDFSPSRERVFVVS